RVVMADLDLDSGKSVHVDGMPDLREHRVEVEVQPADVGVIGFKTVRVRPPEVLPERNASPLGGKVPERDVDGGERELSDSRSTNPLQGRAARKLGPQASMVRSILVDEQRRVAIR